MTGIVTGISTGSPPMRSDPKSGGGIPAGRAGEASGSLFSRQERFALVTSTNDVVRHWLAAGIPEVCLAVADEQAAGRGRAGRSWIAPPGAALLCSLGFRPTWLEPERTWQLAAVVALAMADAAEAVAALPDRAVLLKWPNDLVIVDGGETDPRPGTLRKLAGVLGETEGLGTVDPAAVVGIGLNAGWARSDFPTDLAPGMTSLNEVSGGRSVDLDVLLEAFKARIESRLVALRAGRFDADEWAERQLTTDRDVRLDLADGTGDVMRALGVDPTSGALVVADAAGGERRVLSGEVVRVRLVGSATAGAAHAADAPDSAASRVSTEGGV